MQVLDYLFGADFRCCDVMGNAITGGHLEVYLEGESGIERCATYSDFEGHENPFRIPIPMNGMPIIIVDSSRMYRVHCYNILGVQIWSRYNVRCSAPEILAGDCMEVDSQTGEAKNATTISIADNSIGKSKLKGARDLIVDEQHLKMNKVDGKIVLSLSDKLAKDLADSGYDVDDVDIDIQDVTGLQSVLNNKSNVGHTHTKSSITDFAHTHTKNEITDFPSIPTKTSDLDNDSGFITDANADDKQYARKNNSWVEVEGGSGASSWDDITGKPSTFPPSSHTHSTSDVDGLDSVLRGKADDSGVVHTTGNESVSGTKTFSNEQIFNTSVSLKGNLKIFGKNPGTGYTNVWATPSDSIVDIHMPTSSGTLALDQGIYYQANGSYPYRKELSYVIEKDAVQDYGESLYFKLNTTQLYYNKNIHFNILAAWDNSLGEVYVTNYGRVGAFKVEANSYNGTQFTGICQKGGNTDIYYIRVDKPAFTSRTSETLYVWTDVPVSGQTLELVSEDDATHETVAGYPYLGTHHDGGITMVIARGDLAGQTYKRGILGSLYPEGNNTDSIGSQGWVWKDAYITAVHGTADKVKGETGELDGRRIATIDNNGNIKSNANIRLWYDDANGAIIMLGKQDGNTGTTASAANMGTIRFGNRKGIHNVLEANNNLTGRVTNYLPASGGTLALDSEVVHNTGNETIAGEKTFASDAYFDNKVRIAAGKSIIFDSSDATKGNHQLMADNTTSSENYDIALPDKSGTLAVTTDIPTKTSDITNDSGFITDAPADGNQYARKDGAWEAVHGAWENLNLSIVDGCESWLSFSSIESKINRSLKCISISGTFILKSSMPSGWNNCITFNPPQGIDSNLQIPFRIFAANNSYGIECFLYGDGRILFNRRSAPFSGDVYFLTSTPFILFF